MPRDSVRAALLTRGLQPPTALLTLFDLFVVAVMALSVLFGSVRGLTREAITLAALCGGLLCVGVLAGPLGGMAGDGLIAVLVVLFVLFAIGFVAVHVGLEMIVRRAIGAVPAKLDRLMGAVFGAARGWFLVGLTFLAMTYYFEAAALPDVLSNAWTRGFAAYSANALDAMGIEGRGGAVPPGPEQVAP